jgi:hypothetical protein
VPPLRLPTFPPDPLVQKRVSAPVVDARPEVSYLQTLRLYVDAELRMFRWNELTIYLDFTDVDISEVTVAFVDSRQDSIGFGNVNSAARRFEFEEIVNERVWYRVEL